MVRVRVSKYEMRRHILLKYITYNTDLPILLLGNRNNRSINLIVERSIASLVIGTSD
jgi:hypothetical protein